MAHCSLFIQLCTPHRCTPPSMPPKQPSLLPPPVTHDGVLDRTLQNLDLAQGSTAHLRIPVSEVRRPDDHGTWKRIYASAPLASRTDTIISDSAARSRSSLDDMAPANMHDVVPETPLHGPEPVATNDRDRLEQITVDRRRLVDDLNASTALIKNLRLRCQIHEADLARCKASLDSCRIDADTKINQALKDRMVWLITTCASLGMSAVYIGWCWVNRAEFEYIQRRRREMFGL